ncbi:MAG: MBL fold metallo-hydrolase [Bacteroidales bacterium]|nr:MBL fold metallo-hydrolase [Bacteroidales bacterium]
MQLHTFNIANFKIDGGAMFGVVPQIIWSKLIHPDANNLIPLALRSLVIETDGRVILIDNGIGDKQNKKFMNRLGIYGGVGLIEGLASCGLNPGDITDMILTHLHFDHCGGGIRQDKKGNYLPVFPNAKYWVSREQWDNAMDPNPREADSFLAENILPMKESGVLKLIEEEGSFCSGVELRIVHGHTPGQLIPVINLGKKKLLFGADLFPTRAHVPVKYNMAYDLEVLKTMNEKEDYLSDIADQPTAILFEHDVDVECGLVSNTEKGYKVVKTMSLEEWLS